MKTRIVQRQEKTLGEAGIVVLLYGKPHNGHFIVSTRVAAPAPYSKIRKLSCIQGLDMLAAVQFHNGESKLLYENIGDNESARLWLSSYSPAHRIAKQPRKIVREPRRIIRR